MGRIKFSFSLSVLGLLLTISIIYTMFRLYSLGAFSDVEENALGKYEVLSDVDGPEALQVDHEAEVLYFINNNPCSAIPATGAIYKLNLKKSGLQPELQLVTLSDFHPHGLSYFKDENGIFLATNNHRQDGSHTVEIFKVLSDNTLEHLETISSDLLTSPNDLVAVSPRKFYVTIDGRSHDRTTRAIDTFLGRSTGSVLFYDGNKFIKAVDNLNFPNGIAINKHLNTLVIGETLSGKLVFYQIVENYALQYVDNLHIGVGIDNISFNKDFSNLYVSMHPNLLQLSKHMKNVDNPSASQVIEFNYRTKGLKRIFETDGRLISGVSASVFHNDCLYLGAVCDNVLLKVQLYK